jgi:hypothetical protein
MMIYTGNYKNEEDENSNTVVFPNKVFTKPTYAYHTYDIGQDMAAGGVFSCGMSTLVSLSSSTFSYTCMHLTSHKYELQSIVAIKETKDFWGRLSFLIIEVSFGHK